MAQPAHGANGGWATNRPVGGQGRTPTIGQKQLRGKMVNLIKAGNIKRPQLCTVNNNEGRTRRTVGNIDRKEKL